MRITFIAVLFCIVLITILHTRFITILHRVTTTAVNHSLNNSIQFQVYSQSSNEGQQENDQSKGQGQDQDQLISSNLCINYYALPGSISQPIVDLLISCFESRSFCIFNHSTSSAEKTSHSKENNRSTIAIFHQFNHSQPKQFKCNSSVSIVSTSSYERSLWRSAIENANVSHVNKTVAETQIRNWLIQHGNHLISSIYQYSMDISGIQKYPYYVIDGKSIIDRTRSLLNAFDCHVQNDSFEHLHHALHTENQHNQNVSIVTHKILSEILISSSVKAAFFANFSSVDEERNNNRTLRALKEQNASSE